jgi:hypothetical protein
MQELKISLCRPHVAVIVNPQSSHSETAHTQVGFTPGQWTTEGNRRWGWGG